VFFDLLWIIIAILLLYFGGDITWATPYSMDCTGSTAFFDAENASCYGLSFVARISFVLACFHFLMFLSILPRGTCVSIFHDGCWMFKFLIVLAGFIASLWIPNYNFIKGYLYATLYISAAFLFYQAMLMLIVSYKINDLIVGNYNRNPSGCNAALIVITTLVFTTISIVWTSY
jgi:hypothetical protein